MAPKTNFPFMPGEPVSENFTLLFVYYGNSLNRLVFSYRHESCCISAKHN